LRNENSTLRRERQSLQAEAAQLCVEAEKLSAEYAKLRNDTTGYATLRTEHETLRSESDRVRQALDNLNIQFSRLMDEKRDLLNQQQCASTQNQQLINQLTMLKEINQRITREKEEAIVKIRIELERQRNEEVEKIMRENETWKLRVTELYRDKQRLAKDKRQLEENLDKEDALNSKLERELKGSQEKHVVDTQHMQQLSEDKTALINDANEARKRIVDLQRQRDQVQNAFDQAQQQIKRVETEVLQVSAQLNRIQTKYNKIVAQKAEEDLIIERLIVEGEQNLRAVEAFMQRPPKVTVVKK